MRRMLLPLCLVTSLGASPALADQLQCNDEGVAQAAVERLPAGSIFIDFCSLCEAKAQVVRVKAARIVEDCDFEIEVEGEVITETSVAFSDGYVPGKAQYVVPANKAYKQRIDLAYAYIEAGENDFQWLGGQLGKSATVNTASIQLPGEVYAKLGDHPRPQGGGAPVKSAAPAPGTAAVQRVFQYFRTGEAGPVLGHVVPCLSLDLAKGSPSRYECKEPVTGAVAPGTEVFVWMDWLVPRATNGLAEVRFVKDGAVKLTKRVKLKGKPRTPIVPATAGAKLSKLGVYKLQVYLDGEMLSEVSIEVRK